MLQWKNEFHKPRLLLASPLDIFLVVARRSPVYMHETFVVVWCSALQFVAVCCSLLQCVVVWCSALQYGAVHCSMLQCVVVQCSALQYVAVHCSLLQCGVVWCNALQYGAVHFSLLQCVVVRAVSCSVSFTCLHT